ncbi:pyridoxamine 5'-phosphate oxidase family protein [Kocuria sp. JC486]|uniref:pyridoxamine 5'-phosphate oxidase family protein n=1 Tax=Kocuria sp. JC486 TaxID=1970736 RepID=UPI001420157B|nr:pyridoxamine 5'-phosphate oxidase family protein [Kocuria sp. JC486]NHU86236.1 pyridoxamine 5'-phosphate oxidase family protein [Kocuria sp. JC486]
MTDFQDNARAALIEFVEQNPGGVLATHPQSGDFPEAAWINLAVTAPRNAAEQGEIVFGTDRRSRKALNIGARPEVSLVVVSGQGQEIQVEALARVLGGDDAVRAGDAIAAAHPEGGGDPDYVCVVGLKPTWVRWVDVSTTPPTMQDFEV